MAENGLDLSFDVDYEEDEEGIELEETSSSDSDNDEGDLGDLDLEEDNNFAAGDLVGLGVREAAATGGAAAYQHEPEPRHAPDMPDDAHDDEVWPRRNGDITRLDPNNTANW